MKLLIPPPLQALVCAGLIWVSSIYLPALNFQFAGQNLLAVILAACGLAIDISAIRLFSRAKTTVNPLDPASQNSWSRRGFTAYTQSDVCGFWCVLAGVWHVDRKLECIANPVPVRLVHHQIPNHPRGEMRSAKNSEIHT